MGSSIIIIIPSVVSYLCSFLCFSPGNSSNVEIGELTTPVDLIIILCSSFVSIPLRNYCGSCGAVLSHCGWSFYSIGSNLGMQKLDAL